MSKRISIIVACSIAILAAIFAVFKVLSPAQTRIVNKYKNGTTQVITLTWNKNGFLTMWKTEYVKGLNRQEGFVPLINHENVIYKEMNLKKQEMDFKKARTNAPYYPEREFVYTKDKLIVFCEVFNGDGRNDSLSYFNNGRIERTEISHDRDGVFDSVQYYDEDGNPTYSEYDSDGDGKPDKRGVKPGA